MAMRVISASNEVMSEQIKKLQNESRSLEEKLHEKDRQIAELRAQVDIDKDRLAYIEDSKLMLERKIETYNQRVKSLMMRKEIAAQSLVAFRSDFFDAAHLKEKLDAELDKTMKEIDRTSFDKTWRSAGENAARRAREVAIEEHKARAEKARLEAIAEGANKKHAYYDDDDERRLEQGRRTHSL
jgi:hypothetical protein